MNKLINFVAVSAVTLFFSSCSKSDDINNTPQNGETALVTFSADTETSLQTRANFKDLGGQSAAFQWEMNDQVGVYAAESSNLGTLSVIEVSSSTNKATLQGNIVVGEYYLGVYPKSAVISKSANNTVVVNIPANQIVPTSTQSDPKYVDPKAFIQVGYTKTNAFTMMTPCAFLRFSTGSKANIKSVKVIAYDSSNNAYAIVGNVSVEKSESSSINLGTASNTSNEVSCTYEGGNFPQNCTFGIAIRPGTYAKIKIVVTDENGETVEKTSTSMYDPSASTKVYTGLTFERAYYYPMGDLSTFFSSGE